VVVKGVDYMNDDPSNVDVLFARTSLADGSDGLQRFADAVAAAFREAGMLDPPPGGGAESSSVKLHATLINSKKAGGGSGEDDDDGGAGGASDVGAGSGSRGGRGGGSSRRGDGVSGGGGRGGGGGGGSGGRRQDQQQRKQFDARALLKAFSDYEFGTAVLNEVHLSRMSHRQRGSFYDAETVVRV
jgi:hypothetical protein